MAKKKYYAVRRGHTPGIYETWDDCKRQVDGYKGAVYKSFLTKAEALSFLRGHDSTKLDIAEKLTPQCPIAFTDGSYEHALRRYGYGVLILEDTGEGEPVETGFCGCGSNPAYLESRNIAGEALGILKAMEWAAGHGYSQLRICYDYAGLEKWATGAWKTNKPVSIDYVREYRKYAGKVGVVFEKVKGHSNNYYNDRADALAKEGVARGKEG